jgi:hypothetical protein
MNINRPEASHGVLVFPFLEDIKGVKSCMMHHYGYYRMVPIDIRFILSDQLLSITKHGCLSIVKFC